MALAGDLQGADGGDCTVHAIGQFHHIPIDPNSGDEATPERPGS